MLKVIDFQTGDELPFVDYENLKITHKADGFQNKMSFYIDPDCDFYKNIVEETKIIYADNEWLVKKIQDGDVECDLNFDFLKQSFHKNFKSETASLTELLSNTLPNGWTFNGSNVVSIKRTISFDYCTDYDVLVEAQNVYDVYFVWSILEKKVVVHSPLAMQSTGEYVTEELNLTRLSYQGDTKELITRLYCVGKDGVTIADGKDANGVTHGLEYIDDFSYTDKIICGYWKDERYTNPDELLKDGKEKLYLLANPVRSYECEVVDLAKMSDEYSFLDFKLHKKVTLLYKEREQRIEHQIVEYTEYPDEPERNIVTLAYAPVAIQANIKKVGEVANDNLSERTSFLNERILITTALLTTALGGYVYQQDGAIYILDNENPALAQSVWVWNINGFGHSSTGIDGPYNMGMTNDDNFLANTITTAILNADLIKAGKVKAQFIEIGTETYFEDGYDPSTKTEYVISTTEPTDKSLIWIDNSNPDNVLWKIWDADSNKWKVGPGGETGSDAITSVLSNDSHTVPTDASGNNGNFTGANTTFSVFDGTVDVTDLWTISQVRTSGLTVTGATNSRTASVTASTVDVGTITFTATRTGYPTQTKVFTITKAKGGNDGKAYWLVSDTVVIKKATDGTYTPATVNVSAKSQVGSGVPVAYNGKLEIDESTDGTSYTNKYSSTGNESSKQYTPSAGIKSLRVRLFLNVGTGGANLLDEQIIPVVSDGAAGGSGPTGSPATSYWLTCPTSIQFLNDLSYLPANFKAAALSQTGTAAPASFSGIFKIYESLDGTNYTLKYTSASNESSKTYTPTQQGVKTFKVQLYLPGGTSLVYETIVVVTPLNELVGKSGDLNGITFDPVNGMEVKTTSGTIRTKVTLNASGGIKIERSTNSGSTFPTKLFWVDSATGNVNFNGNLSGATGTFTGAVTTTGSVDGYDQSITLDGSSFRLHGETDYRKIDNVINVYGINMDFSAQYVVGEAWIPSYVSINSTGFSTDRNMFSNVAAIYELTRNPNFDNASVWSSANFSPWSSNSYTLGNSTYRWKEIWTNSGSFNPSDRRLKDHIGGIPDEVLDAWSEVDFIQFKFRDAIEEKGEENARLHIGLIAQEIEAAFIRHGLNAFDYGLLGFDEWEEEITVEKERLLPKRVFNDDLGIYEIKDEIDIYKEKVKTGNMINQYSIRPDECQFLEMALMRREMNRLKALN